MTAALEEMTKPPGSLIEPDGTDVLADVLYSLQLRGRIFCRCDFGAPWSFHVTPDGTGHFHLIERGNCWFSLPNLPTGITLETGDLLLLLHGKPYTMSDDAGTPTIPLTEIVGESHGSARTRLEYGGSGPQTHVICGSFEFRGPQAKGFLTVLPNWILVQQRSGYGNEWLNTTMRYLQREIRSPEMGADMIITSLVNVLFVQAVRTWLKEQPASAGGWLGALRDPAIGGALGLIHGSPQTPWTVPRLAREVGMSRSPFAARFTTSVGMTPMSYLKRWRLQLATRLLQNPVLTLASVSERVGYDSVEAFSRVFRREFGLAPGQYRRAHAPGGSRSVLRAPPRGPSRRR
jgi:AraC-like DNA-binding protein